MALPEIILPKWMTKIGTKLPGKPPRFVLVSVLNTMLRKGLLPADMELFAGRKFEIEVLDAGIKVRFSADTEKFLDDQLQRRPRSEAGRQRHRLHAHMMREEDPDTLFFNRKLQIEGDTELGLITKNLLDSVEWPFSEWFLKRSTSTLD